MSTTAEDVLASLEWRLNRLEHVLQGTDTDTVIPTTTTSAQSPIFVRLAVLDERLATLTRETPVIADLLRLHTSLPNSISQGTKLNDGTGLSSVDKAAVVIASAPTFNSAQSSLSNLEGIKLEDASTLIPFVSIQRGLVRAQVIQQAQESEVALLRERTARLLAQWYQDSVLTGGERLADWEERLLDVEKVIKRREVAQAREKML